MTKPTLKSLAARLAQLEERVAALAELLDEKPADPEPTGLEAQHVAFRARLKEKRRCA